MATDAAIEAEIIEKGKTAPRITPSDIEANIASEHYFTAAEGAHAVSEEMVSRFLTWSLPKDFVPDCGISFDGRKDDELNKNKGWPVGTNLLTATQARAMLEHVMQAPPPEAIDANVAPGCSLFSDPRKLAPARLPSHFQIGDMVQIQREGEPKSLPQPVEGVQFTEGKVHYLIADQVVDSCFVLADPK